MENNRHEVFPLSWDDPRGITQVLLTRYSKPVDVLSLSDKSLTQLLESEGVLAMLPPIDPAKQEDILFLLKCAIARRAESDEEDCGDGRYDAEI